MITNLFILKDKNCNSLFEKDIMPMVNIVHLKGTYARAMLPLWIAKDTLSIIISKSMISIFDKLKYISVFLDLLMSWIFMKHFMHV